MQLPPVWSNEISGLAIGRVDVVTDIGDNNEQPLSANRFRHLQSPVLVGVLFEVYGVIARWHACSVRC